MVSYPWVGFAVRWLKALKCISRQERGAESLRYLQRQWMVLINNA